MAVCGFGQEAVATPWGPYDGKVKSSLKGREPASHLSHSLPTCSITVISKLQSHAADLQGYAHMIHPH
jgi:hypothetical protein